MKQQTIIIVVVTIFLGAGQAWAWGPWQWQGKEEKPVSATPSAPDNLQDEKNEDATRSERFCLYDQQEDLLKLLDELEKLKTGSGKVGQSGKRNESIVRAKYRIARKLRQFDDCRAEDALNELIKENDCEDLGVGEIFCVAWGAKPSLQEVKSKKDLKKITTDTPLVDQLKVVKKYGAYPHSNEFASHAVMKFLIAQVAQNPDVYVPLLVEYFPGCHEIIPAARTFPKQTNTGLKRCFLSKEPAVVWSGISLARTLNKVELFPVVFDVAFAGKGLLDYARPDEISGIQTMALGFLRIDEKAALPYYRKILFGDFPKVHEYVISGSKDLDNPELLALFKDFSSHLKQKATKNAEEVLLLERLQRKIAGLEDVRK